jgi:hypothetical protein
LFITVPYDIKTTRSHNWNVALQQQFGESTAVSVTYLGNRLVNMWGVVDGNPGTVPAATPTSACTLRLPTGGTQTFANCSTAPLDLRRELSQSNPSVGQFYGYLDYVTDAGWQNYHGLLLSAQRRLTSGLTATANYTVSSCEGLISQGQSPLNVATGYMKPVSIINPPSEAEAQAIYENDKGNCEFWRRHIFNLTASYETPQFNSTAARLLGSGWRISGVFRAQSGRPLTITTGIDRALSGIQPTIQRGDQILDDPYGNGTRDQWLNPAAFAQPALGTYGNSKRNDYFGMGTRVVDLAFSRSFDVGGSNRIEARVEAFNAFNAFVPSTSNPGQSPVTALNNVNFGRYLASDDPRVMQFAVKYSF